MRIVSQLVVLGVRDRLTIRDANEFGDRGASIEGDHDAAYIGFSLRPAHVRQWHAELSRVVAEMDAPAEVLTEAPTKEAV